MYWWVVVGRVLVGSGAFRVGYDVLADTGWYEVDEMEETFVGE